MKGRANTSPITALSFPYLKHYPCTAGLTEFSNDRYMIGSNKGFMAHQHKKVISPQSLDDR